MSPRRRTIVAWTLAFAVLATVTATRVVLEARSEVRAGDAALERREHAEAIRRLRRAAHWYLPLNPYCRGAFERLERIALQAERDGRRDHAFGAWRAIRASALATRWLIVPERARLERANRHIAALLAEMPGGPQDRDVDHARAREEHHAALTNDRSPEPAWVVVMLIGFLLWAGAAVWAARNGFDEHDKPIARRLLVAAAIVLFGGVMFVSGIALA